MYTTIDTTKQLWAEKCTSIRTLQSHLQDMQTTPLDTESTECHGYALKNRKKVPLYGFSYNVKDYLLNIFQAGENSGKGLNPYTVDKMISNELALIFFTIRLAQTSSKFEGCLQIFHNTLKRVTQKSDSAQGDDIEDVIKTLVATEAVDSLKQSNLVGRLHNDNKTICNLHMYVQ